MKEFDSRLNFSWWALRIGLATCAIAAGIDKYFNILADWSMYLSPAFAKFNPVSTATLMHAVGVVEIMAGTIVLSRWTRLGSYIVMAWLLCISVNLLSSGMFLDLAVRDIEMAIGAFALSQLTVVREETLPVGEQNRSQFALNH